MARQRGGTAKRPTAADKAKKKQIADLEKKLQAEIDKMNEAGARQNVLEAELAAAKEQVAISQGRCSMLADQLLEHGVVKVQVPQPQKDDEEK